MCLLDLAIQRLLVIRTKVIWGLEKVEIEIERVLQGKWTKRKWREGKCNFFEKAGYEKELRKGIEAGRK